MLRRANARRLVWTARGAAEDRRAAQAELALETADDLTGALRRNAGLRGAAARACSAAAGRTSR